MIRSRFVFKSEIFNYKLRKQAIEEIKSFDPRIEQKIEMMTPDEEGEFFSNFNYIKHLKSGTHQKNIDWSVEDLQDKGSYWGQKQRAERLRTMKQVAEAHQQGREEYANHPDRGAEKVARLRKQASQREKGFASRAFRRLKTIQSRQAARISSMSARSIVVDTRVSQWASRKVMFRQTPKEVHHVSCAEKVYPSQKNELSSSYGRNTVYKNLQGMCKK